MSSSRYHVRALWTAVATAIIPVIGEPAAADLRHIVSDDDLETVPGQIAAVLADDATPVVLVLDNLHEITSSPETSPPSPAPSSGPRVGGRSPANALQSGRRRSAGFVDWFSSPPTRAPSATSTDGRRSGTADTPCPSTPPDTPCAAA